MRELAATDFVELVERVRQGPPGWSAARIARVDEVVNGGEFFIHHEDLLRGTPGFERRRLDVGHERFLWDMLKRGSRLYFRQVPVGVVLVAEGHGRHAAKKPTDNGTVVLRGRPGELVMYASGRSGWPRSSSTVRRRRSPRSRRRGSGCHSLDTSPVLREDRRQRTVTPASRIAALTWLTVRSPKWKTLAARTASAPAATAGAKSSAFPAPPLATIGT